MGLLKFNKTPKNKRFDYIPRYYDPKKEELENLVNSYNEAGDTDLTKERIKSGLRNKYRGDATYKKKLEKSANIRLLSIIFVLFIVTYLILRSETILNIVQTFVGE